MSVGGRPSEEPFEQAQPLRCCCVLVLHLVAQEGCEARQSFLVERVQAGVLEAVRKVGAKLVELPAGADGPVLVVALVGDEEGECLIHRQGCLLFLGSLFLWAFAGEGLAPFLPEVVRGDRLPIFLFPLLVLKIPGLLVVVEVRVNPIYRCVYLGLVGCALLGSLLLLAPLVGVYLRADCRPESRSA